MDGGTPLYSHHFMIIIQIEYNIYLLVFFLGENIFQHVHILVPNSLHELCLTVISLGGRCLQQRNSNDNTYPYSSRGGADLPPPSRICVYARVYTYTRANFLWLFLVLNVKEGTTVLTSKKFTVFPGTQKVGPICPTFMRGDPYEPHRLPQKVTFSDH